ncbi:MAG: AraC family transcriptional regulator [Sphingomonas phyllosphaerae]
MPATPLRSATNRSDPRIIPAALTEQLAIAGHVGSGGAAHRLSNQTGLLLHARYPAFEGPIENGPHLRVGLCLGAGTRLVQSAGTTRLEGLWRRGTLTITPPDCTGFAACGATEMIGLAIVTDAIDRDRVHDLASRFHDDALIVSVLTALHHEADVHGTTTAFFEHGIALVLNRLNELHSTPSNRRAVRPLSQARYDRLVDQVRGRLGDDLSVAELAAAAGMDPSGFTRAMRARTGLAPFAWLTRCRMEEAARLLAGGLTVTWVASRVGYANASKFAAAFRRLHGMAPSRWQADA